ncbi:acyl-CoA dehydrogenase family protein [Pseudonocardia sp. KRD291]|uniref:acyl-CoA dehydrogenase family protein n=1 Tax=Pseudonocardia sp. KRD291 TaxID=2792007 RepID=UPI001C4A22D0|nr:acyl-CoA dehydrogenase family protein [Pseudonocardia sp. KRD291]MBW0101023.1 acyl-CoA dehydrogenase family protein [Pseudonocardia sp. KRD291]
MTDDKQLWTLPEELLLLRDTVRDFMDREVIPAESDAEPDAFELPPDVLGPLQAKARQAGLWCIGSPEEYGGTGMSLLEQCVVAEEAARCRMGLETPAAGAFGNDPPSVVFGGTEDQIRRFALPTIERGEKTFVALTEPSGGADPARSIRTTAVRDGDDWVLNGSKMWISGADTARWGIVFARTDPSRGRDGISCFLVDPSQPGFEATTIPVIRSWAPCELTFTDHRVPARNLLGEEGKGFTLAQRWLGHGRVRYAAVVLGVAREAIALAARYALQREAFGGPLADKQAVQWPLADSEIELRAARLLVYQAAAMGDRGEEFTVDASIAKVYATEAAGRIVDRCIQIFGGMGVAQEMPLERWYRELRVKRIGEGPSEVHRMLVARHLLRNAKAGRT